jgi:hypothetical protein
LRSVAIANHLFVEDTHIFDRRELLDERLMAATEGIASVRCLDKVPNREEALLGGTFDSGHRLWKMWTRKAETLDRGSAELLSGATTRGIHLRCTSSGIEEHGVGAPTTVVIGVDVNVVTVVSELKEFEVTNGCENGHW